MELGRAREGMKGRGDGDHGYGRGGDARRGCAATGHKHRDRPPWIHACLDSHA